MIRESEFYEELGRRISAARKGKSLTQEQLAERIGLTRTSVTNIEKGRQKVLAHLLVELSGALNEPLVALLPQIDARAKAMDAVPEDVRDWIEKTRSARNSR